MTFSDDLQENDELMTELLREGADALERVRRTLFFRRTDWAEGIARSKQTDLPAHRKRFDW